MSAQRTLRRSVSCTGIGLHSGNKVTLSLKPAPADFGIRFRRTDLGGIEIPATVHHLAGINYATGLSHDAATVETVEHLLSALVSLGVDNVVVELSQPEVPIMDGSAAPFVYLINEAGVKRLAPPRRYLKVVRPISLPRGDKRIAADANAGSLTLSLAAEPNEGDQIVDASGARVFLDSDAALLLDDKALDAEVDSAGAVQFAVAEQLG